MTPPRLVHSNQAILDEFLQRVVDTIVNCTGSQKAGICVLELSNGPLTVEISRDAESLKKIREEMRKAPTSGYYLKH